MRINGLQLALLLLPSVMLLSAGCGTVEESTEETDAWTQPTSIETPPSPPLQDYRIDSLMAENRRLQMQVDAMAAETRVLAARNAELEVRLNDALAAGRAPARVVSPAARATAVPRATTPASYTSALAEYRKRNFSGAAAQFQALLKEGVDEDLEDNAHYWLGESYYGMGRYDDAVEEFQAVFNYARSDKKDDAQMMVGNAYLARRNMKQARAAFEELVSAYPASPYVKRAQEKLADLR